MGVASKELMPYDTIIGDGLYLCTDMYKTKLNNNMLVVGTPGSGKTTGIVEPNILQMNSSYVVLDPKGNLHRKHRAMPEAHGYDVSCVNFVDVASSAGFNPFAFVRTDDDLERVCNSLYYDKDGRKSQEPFWDNAAMALFRAIAAYCRDENDGKFTVREMRKMLTTFSLPPKGDAKECPNRLCEIFYELRNGYRLNGDLIEPVREAKPECPASRYWLAFSGITSVDSISSCIFMELSASLERFSAGGLLHILDGEDAIDFGMLGRRKAALFIVVSDIDRSLDSLVSVLYGELFRELCRVADTECSKTNNRLTVPVRFIMDDFANQAPVPFFDVIIAAVRSRDIWITIICQSTAQITEKYGAAAQTIIGCCDTQVFMGINDMQTAQELSLRTNKPLFEIGSLPLGQEIVFIRGERPMQAKLYDANNHPAIKWAKGRCSSRTIANSCARRIKTDVIDRCRKGDNAWTA